MKTEINGWIARDRDGRLLFYTNEPYKRWPTSTWAVNEGDWFEVEEDETCSFSEVKWENDEPTKVVATIETRETQARKFKRGDKIVFRNREAVITDITENGYHLDYENGGFEFAPKSEEHRFDLLDELQKSCEEGLKPDEPAKIEATAEAEYIIGFFGWLLDEYVKASVMNPLFKYGKLSNKQEKMLRNGIEVLRPEYSSYQQGFNAGHEEGYKARMKEEKRVLTGIRAYIDELKDIDIDEED